MVSVIIPVYNCEEHVGRSIESVLMQTFSDLEVVIVDDGSTDLSLAVCEEYAKKDARVKVFTKPNEGVSEARNFGIEKSLGEFIMFIDADDYIDENTIEKCIEKQKQHNTDMVVFGMRFEFYNGGNLVKVATRTFPNDFIAKEHLADRFFELFNKDYLKSACNKVIKASVIKENDIKFDKNMIQMEDALFNICLLEKIDSMYLMENAFYHYAKHKGATSGSAKLVKDAFEQRMILVNKTNELLNSLAVSDDVRRKVNGIWANMFYGCMYAEFVANTKMSYVVG